MTRKQRRLTLIGCALVVARDRRGAGADALRDSIVFFLDAFDGRRKSISARASGFASAAWCSRVRCSVATILR